MARFIASDIAETSTGGEVGLAKLMVESKNVVTVKENPPEGCIPSGLVDCDVFVGGMEEMDTKLPREELLEIAEGIVVLRGRDVTTLCFGLILEANINI